MPSASRASELKVAQAAIVVFVSILWSTATLTTWVIVIVVAGAGAVNLMVLGFPIFYGPVLGCIAGGVHALASFVLGRVLPPMPRDIAAALLGWGAALGVWGLLTFSGMDASAIVGSVVVGTVGAALNFAVARSRLGRLA